MLIILLYHRAFVCRYGNAIETLEKHFTELKARYPIVLPGESLQPGTINVCISFDDATYDFYHHVFPLLKKLNMKCLLAVPAGFIEEIHETTATERLNLITEFSCVSPSSKAFCSFQELKEMTCSSLVQVASHGFYHQDTSKKKVNLDEEMVLSKAILENFLKQSIDTFVFPYGKYSFSSLVKAKLHYTTLLRIGGCMNFSWNQPLLYRLNADQTENILALFSKKNLLALFFKTLWKTSLARILAIFNRLYYHNKKIT